MARREISKPPRQFNLHPKHLYALFAQHLLGATANAPTVLSDAEIRNNRRIIFDDRPGATGVTGGTAVVVQGRLEKL